MVISHRHKYLFVELPHTGSTAISKELVEHYDGEYILSKHSYAHAFLRRARPEQRRYFVFSGIRNPLDEAVSIYLKLKGDHKRSYSDPAKWRRNGGWVGDGLLRRYRFILDRGAGFPEYFLRFYRLPYDNWSSLDHGRFHHLIRFERLRGDFEEALRRIGIEPRRPLPVTNATAGKDHDFASYYTPEVRARAVWVFGPFMRRWGYEFPAGWEADPSWTSRVLFHALGSTKDFYRRHLDREPAAAARAKGGVVTRITSTA